MAVFYTWADVQSLQRAIGQDYDLLNPAVMACNVQRKVSDVDLEAWAVMQGRVASFAKRDTRTIADVLSTDTTVAEGKAIQSDLLKWHAKVKAMGCEVADAPTPVVPTADVADFFGGLKDALPAIVIIGLAYLLGRR